MTTRQLLPLFCCVMFLTALAGCCGQCMEGMEAMEGQVTTLVNVLQSCDREGFDAIAASALEDEIDEAKFNGFCEVIGSLGELKETSQTFYGFENSVMKGRYDLEFATGEAQLEINTVNGEVIMFNFSGDAIDAATSGEAAEKPKKKKKSKKKKSKKKDD